MGPIAAMQWTAYGAMDAGDLLTTDSATLHRVFDVAVYGLLAATEEVLPDLKQSRGAILIANGGFGEVSPEIDAFVSGAGLMGLALSSAAKHKLVGLLAARLKNDGVYVGEVMVHGTIEGTSSESADSVDPKVIADKYWELYQSRSETRGVVSAGDSSA
jgi:short-subunit dehydrogenase